MSWWSDIKQLVRDRISGRDRLLEAMVPFEGRFGQYYQPDVSKTSLLRRYEGDTYSIVSLIAQSCATVPLRLYTVSKSMGDRSRALPAWEQRQVKSRSSVRSRIKLLQSGTEELREVEEHPLLDLLSDVNPILNAFEFVEGWMVFRELVGEVYVFVLRNDFDGMPLELWFLPPDRIFPIMSKRSLVEAWELRSAGTATQRFETEEVIYHKAFSPCDPLRGWSPLRAGIRSADMSNRIMDFENTLLSNYAVPSLLIGLKGAGERERERLEKRWRDRFGGRRSGRVGVVSSEIDVKKLGMTPREMGHDKALDKMRDRNCNTHHLPKALITADAVNRANAEAGVFSFMRFAIEPRLDRMQQSLNQDLVPMFDPDGAQGLILCFDSAVPEDKEFRLKERVANIKSGYSLIDEERARDGLEPRPDGGGLEPPSRGPVMPAEATGEQQDDEEGSGARSIVRAVGLVGKVTDEPGAAPQASGFAGVLRELFDDQRKFVMAQIDAQKALKQAFQPGALSGVLFQLDHWNGRLAEESLPFIRRMTFEGAEGGREQVRSLGVVFNLEPVDVTPFYEQRAAEFSSRMAGGINQETLRSLVEELQTGAAAGEHIAQIEKRVERIFEFGDKVRSTRIARTETKRALEAGRRASYQETGVKRLQWVADPDACEFCKSFDGKIVAVEGELFARSDDGQVIGTEGGTMALVPGFGDVGHPPLHPNCTCFIIPILD